MLKCRFHNSTITKLVDVGLEHKAEVDVTCKDGWHIREGYINRFGVELGRAVICMCPQRQADHRNDLEIIANSREQIQKARNWTHVSLQDRRRRGSGDVDDFSEGL